MSGLALDSSGNLYVGKRILAPIASAAVIASSVETYGPGFTAGSTPLRTLSLPAGDDPTSLFVDASGKLYVLSHTSGTALIYAKGATGMDAPLRTIHGTATQMAAGQAFGLSVDASGYMYVGVADPSQVLIFTPSADGDVAPARTITCSNGAVYGVATDSTGRLFAALSTVTVHTDGSDSSVAEIDVFAPGSTGAASPVFTIAGSATTLVNLAGIRLDSAANIWAVNLTQDAPRQYTSHVVEFLSGTTGNIAPAVNFNSTAWGFGGPEIAVE